MFGELGNSDINDNEPNYGFDEFYNGDNNYPSDNDRVSASSDDDFWDAGSGAYEQPAQQNYAAPQGGYNQGTSGVQQNYGAPQAGYNQGTSGAQQNYAPQQGAYNQGAAPQQNAPYQASPAANAAPKKSSGMIYLLLLLLICGAAAGMFYYKKNMAPGSDTQAEQSMGDYFYDKASTDTAVNGANTTDNGTATVDVNLTGDTLPAKPGDDAAAAGADKTQAANDEASSDAKADTAKAEAKDEKELTPLERAKLKKKADEKKESQLGLSGQSVIIPVSAGGRMDPFMPYMQKVALSKQPKFELIAPPTTIPEADPVVDEMVQTKISGIMYDSARPSAIINIGGEDQLVHKGDNVKGYNILNITKNSVVLKYKNNIYQATVGQTLEDGVNLNPVSGLSNQFGGAYTKSAGSVIQFNK